MNPYLYPQDWLLVLAGAMVVASLVVAVVAKTLAYRTQRDIDAELDYGRVRPRNETIRLATLPELKDLELRAQARIVAEARETNKLRLVVSGSSQRIH